MSLTPTIASHGLTVPPGTSVQSRPSVSANSRLPVCHQGAVVVSKVPFGICSGPSASAVAGDPFRQVAASAATARMLNLLSTVFLGGVGALPNR